MVDESTLGLPLLTGVLIFISLFITWYRGVDPLVSLPVAFLLLSGANKPRSIAWRHPLSRIFRPYPLILVRFSLSLRRC